MLSEIGQFLWANINRSLACINEKTGLILRQRLPNKVQVTIQTDGSLITTKDLSTILYQGKGLSEFISWLGTSGWTLLDLIEEDSTSSFGGVLSESLSQSAMIICTHLVKQ